MTTSFSYSFYYRVRLHAVIKKRVATIIFVFAIIENHMDVLFVSSFGLIYWPVCICMLYDIMIST